MSTALFIGDMRCENFWRCLPMPTWLATALRYLLSGLLLSIFSARAEAPAPSQEFWNYFVEFGDAQGELFDPSDYAAVVNLPPKASQEIDKAKQKIENASELQRLEQAPSENNSAREQSQ